MNTVKLKNIVIAILLLLNVLLITLLAAADLEEQRAYDHAIGQLTVLYENNGIALDGALIPQNVALAMPAPARDLAAEESFCTALFGSAVADDVGGGIYRYRHPDEPALGECLFRTNGTVEGSVHRSVDDPMAFCSALCKEFGYTEFQKSGDTVTATRTFVDAKVYNCSLIFVFEDGALHSVSGTFLPRMPLDEERFAPDLITALTRFLDYRNSTGLVCTQVTGVDCGYLLRPTASMPLQLVPVAHVTTDVSDYYVNLTNFEISRRDSGAVMALSAQ